MTEQALDEAAAAIYAAPLGSFAAERDLRAAAARRAGDRELAAQVKALRKPTQSAWLVNQLVRRRGDVVEEVVALGAGLREAEHALSGAALRELATQRTRLVGALVRDAETIAGEAGARPSQATLDEVRSTLEAALADADVAERVLSGRLVRPEVYAGFAVVGPAPGPRPAKSPAQSPAQSPAKSAAQQPAKDPAKDPVKAQTPGPAKPAPRSAAAAAARAERRHAAEAAVTSARATARRRSREAQTAESQRARVAAELDRLRARVADLERRLGEASLEARASAKQARDAEAALAGAEAALARLS